MVAIATSPTDNIRMNGTGKAFTTVVGSTTSIVDLGEAATFELSIAVENEKIQTNRSADHGDIIDREKSRSATLNITLWEWTKTNIEMALLGSTFADNNQTAGNLSNSSTTGTNNVYTDLGYHDVRVLKLTHGAIGGGGGHAWALGETVTGGTSAATAVIRWIDGGGTYIECNTYALGGGVAPFVVGETITTPDTDSATLSGVAVNEDVIFGDAAVIANRGVAGTDYNVLPDSGFVRPLTLGGGTYTSPFFISCYYGALSRSYTYAMSASSVEKRIIFDTDKDDEGPRFRYIFHKVKLMLNGVIPLLGSGIGALTFQGTILKDTSQAAGQEYFTKYILD